MFAIFVGRLLVALAFLGRTAKMNDPPHEATVDHTVPCGTAIDFEPQVQTQKDKIQKPAETANDDAIAGQPTEAVVEQDEATAAQLPKQKHELHDTYFKTVLASIVAPQIEDPSAFLSDSHLRLMPEKLGVAENLDICEQGVLSVEAQVALVGSLPTSLKQAASAESHQRQEERDSQDGCPTAQRKQG